MRLVLLTVVVATTALGEQPVKRPRARAGRQPTTAPRTAPSSTAALTPLTTPQLRAPELSAPLVALAPALPTEDAVDTVPFEISEARRMAIAVVHPFSRAEARTRVMQLLSYWSERFGVKSEWHGYRVFLSGRVMGVDLQALFEVAEHEVLALASDPGTLLRSSAETYVDRKLRKYLSPTYDEP